jgi:hypothetical protein
MTTPSPPPDTNPPGPSRFLPQSWGGNARFGVRRHNGCFPAFPPSYAHQPKKDSKNEEKSICRRSENRYFISSSLLCVTLSDTPHQSVLLSIISFSLVSPPPFDVFVSLFRFCVLLVPSLPAGLIYFLSFHLEWLLRFCRGGWGIMENMALFLFVGLYNFMSDVF